MLFYFPSTVVGNEALLKLYTSKGLFPSEHDVKEGSKLDLFPH